VDIVSAVIKMRGVEDIQADLRRALVEDGIMQQACEDAATEAGWKAYNKYLGELVHHRTGRVKKAALAAYDREYRAVQGPEGYTEEEYEEMLKYAQMFAEHVSELDRDMWNFVV
jgi:hypothetical protein